MSRTPGPGPVARLRATIGEAIPDILRTLIVQARSGDMQAAKLLIERAAPAIRPESLPQALPLLPESAGLSAQGEAILAAVRDGSLGVHEAAALLSAIGSHARAVEVHELLRRVEQLEKGSARDQPAEPD